jgi:hypothetical protein
VEDSAIWDVLFVVGIKVVYSLVINIREDLMCLLRFHLHLINFVVVAWTTALLECEQYFVILCLLFHFLISQSVTLNHVSLAYRIHSAPNEATLS